jgi:F5/8 type C domain
MAACGVASCVNGQSCKADADCSSEKCQDGVCKVRCLDGERDGDETGIDCGMAACSKTCPPGQGCAGDADCDGGKCLDSICRAASCEDHLQNGAESDTDCGGDQGCARCTVNQHCNNTADCDGGLCGSGQCRAPTCKDELTNGTETDVDCGGDACLPCAPGKVCGKTTDCDDVACTKGKCQPAACDDQLVNLDETDQDCGGSCATKCEDAKHCKVAADCQSGVCPTGTKRCAAPSCSDGVLNGGESTADCGAGCVTKCAVLDTCTVGDDCASKTCTDKRCLPAAATGQTLPMIGWRATASNSLMTSDPKLGIDGNTSTNWISGADQAPGMWFQVDMTKAQVLFSVEMDVNQQDPDPAKSDLAAAVDIAFSDDPLFTDAAPIVKNRTISDHAVLVLDKPQVGRYLRVTLTLGKNRWWRLDEIRVKQ